MTEPTRRLSDWLVNLLLRALIGLVLLLPWRLRGRVMGWIVRVIIAPLAGYRGRALTQLANVWPDRQSEHPAIAAVVARNAGRTFIENYSPGFSAHLAGTPLQGPGVAALSAARENGTPVLFLATHFGNHDAARHVLHAHGFPTGGLYRPMANGFFNDHYVQTLARVSGPVFPQTRKGLAGLVAHLKSGGFATLFFDVWDKSGASIDFLGQPAPTALSAAELALKYNAALVPYFAIRRPGGTSFDVIIEEPIAPSDPITMMTEATQRLEVRITDHPGQWFWFHRRWKPERQS